MKKHHAAGAPTPWQRLVRILYYERSTINYIYIYAMLIGLIGLTLPLGTSAVFNLLANGAMYSSTYLLIAVILIGIVIGGLLLIGQLTLVEVIEQKIFTKAINIYPTDEHDLLGKHILVVEDNPMNQMIIQMILEDWKNTKVSIADDGAQSLDLLKSDESIDLILMDLQMPVMDGYEAIASIRGGLTGLNNSEKPIIVITADVTSKTKERVYNIGANDYMNKPVDEELMYQKITEVLSAKADLKANLTQSA